MFGFVGLETFPRCHFTRVGPRARLRQNPCMAEQARYAFWLKTRRWTLGLLAVWLVVNLAVPWFARDLDRYSFLGFPLGYWLAAEGALFVYVGIIAVYVWVMDRLESALATQRVVTAAVASNGAASEEG